LTRNDGQGGSDQFNEQKASAYWRAVSWQPHSPAHVPRRISFALLHARRLHTLNRSGRLGCIDGSHDSLKIGNSSFQADAREQRTQSGTHHETCRRAAAEIEAA